MKRSSVVAVCMCLCLSMPLMLAACSQKQNDAAEEEIVVHEEVAIADAVEEEEEGVAPAVEEAAADEAAAAAEEDAEEEAAVAEESAAEEAPAAAAEESDAEEKDYDNLVSWGIKVEVPNGSTAVLKGSDYYIYPEHVGSLPYIILSSFKLDTDEQGFLDEFTAYMKGNHSDLQVVEGPTQVKIGDKDCWKIVYAYDIQGYAAKDTRVVTMKNGRQYLFGTKDIDELSISVGDLFEQVIEAADIYGTN